MSETHISGYVYLIGTPIFGWYKIGKSISPEIRINNLGILLPFKIQVMGLWKANNHHLLEKTLHDIYKDKQINGEWFEFTKSEVQELFITIPNAAKIYTYGDDKIPFIDRFSNVVEDTRKEKRVTGVRTQKLRGNFTPEERDARRIESMKQQRIRKESKLANLDKAK